MLQPAAQDNQLTNLRPPDLDTEESSDRKGLKIDNVLSGQVSQSVRAEIKFVSTRALVGLRSLLALFETLRRDFVIHVIKIKYCT